MQRVHALLTIPAFLGPVLAQAAWAPAPLRGGPLDRAHTAVTWADQVDQGVLFGGEGPLGAKLDDTWLLGWAGWSLSPANGPPARASHAMVYDAARNRVVMFGGAGTNGPLADTWEFYGGSWHQVVTPTVPTPRNSHAMEYDRDRGCIVLFGGLHNGSPLGDTWTFDGTDWHHVQPVHSPSPRFSAAMTFDQRRGVMVLFGGAAVNHAPTGDTWEWDGNNWVERTGSLSTSPPDRFHAQLAFDSVRGRCVLFGGEGYNHAVFGDTWEFNGSRWAVVSGGAPTPRKNHVMFHDGAQNHVAVIGGKPPVARDEWFYRDAGIEKYGVATPHCDGTPALHLNSDPTIGNADFGVTVSNAVPTTTAFSDGFMMLSLFPQSQTIPCSTGGGLTTLVLPAPFSPLYQVWNVTVHNDGRGDWSVPVPQSPALSGLEVYVQHYGNHPFTSCPCLLTQGVGGSASEGLRLALR